MAANSNAAAVDELFSPHTSHSTQEGVWIGVDFGTSNSTCAVWDSANGRAKWIRLPPTLAPPQNGKKGRIMPSVALFGTGKGVYEVVDQIQTASVGQEAIESLNKCFEDTTEFAHVSNAFVSSVKRIFGMTAQQLEQKPKLVQSLPFSVVYNHDEVYIELVSLNNSNNKSLLVTPLHVTAILLSRLRQAAQHYLDTEGYKKHLKVPGEGKVRNCVISVPAHYSHHQRQVMQQACCLGGFDGVVSTLTESTAASMAYGLFVSTPSTRNILVFDMGGGTTDITICRENVDSTFQVLVVDGNDCLGGDDMDQALLQVVLNKYKDIGGNDGDLSLQERRRLVRQCRKAKEDFTGNEHEAPVDSCAMLIRGESNNKTAAKVTIYQQEFHTAMEPIVQQAQALVQSALDQFSDDKIDEVVLVGGATRVQQIQTMLKKIFPHIDELCTSVNADSAVAQGAAIQAALLSGLVPPHELRSALMLDALPHAIGVQLDNGDFLPILAKDAALPAKGIASFQLANLHQPGVTLTAVENVGPDMPLEPIQEFTFLLRKLDEKQLSTLTSRSVDIGMCMDTDGKLIVSIFDPLDPEHVAKKRKHEARIAQGGTLDYHDVKKQSDSDAGVSWTTQEMQMMIVPILLFVLYVAVKLTFHEPEFGD